MNTENQEPFKCWALVELMGHQRIAGEISEQTLAGAAFLRVDVPDKYGAIRFTRFYSTAAIYAINPIDKQLAIATALKIEAVPVTPYDIIKLANDKQLGWSEDDEPE